MPRKSQRTAAGARKARNATTGIPEIYNEMLAEAAKSSATRFNEEETSVKRRRVQQLRADLSSAKPEYKTQIDFKDVGLTEEVQSHDGPLTGSDDLMSLAEPQIAYDDSTSSEENDLSWEEVDLGTDKGGDEGDKEQYLDLTLKKDEGTSKKSKSRVPRRSVNKAEREHRLVAHKVHLLCLLVHAHMRNDWCNDKEVQTNLKPLLNPRIKSQLNPVETLTRFQKNQTFLEGLSLLMTIWKSKFRITARGMRKPLWADEENRASSLPTDMDDPLDRLDFQQTALELQGSRDVGAQLFCALLRSANVDARVVCSLQPLSFAATQANGGTPQESKHTFIYETELDEKRNSQQVAADERDSSGLALGDISQVNLTQKQPVIAPQARGLGQPASDVSEDAETGGPASLKDFRKKLIRESRFPVYWVEAYNSASSKWIPVDPLVTHTIGKPSKLEPPLSDPENVMSYVVAFEENGAVKDVTRRYAKAYNAKTRKIRVEMTKGGDLWWWRSLRFYNRGKGIDKRDVAENKELATFEAREPLPRNLQDFKNHSIYALERHMRRNEVIHPKTQIGKVAAGKVNSPAGKKALEPIYRRQDVHVVRSSDGWYRLGREIKPGAQPLKHVAPRRGQVTIDDDEDDQYTPFGQEEKVGIGLYAEFQTDIYVPPPVTHGRVPKNSFGNLDIYVPSMVPKGGVHLPYSEAQKAARLIGIDYADAVTGFEFKGRHGTAVVSGIVVAAEFEEAMLETIEAFMYEREETERKRQTYEALRRWKRFMAGVRIRERVKGYATEGEENSSPIAEADDDDDDAAATVEDNGGGFFPDADQGPIAEPTASRSVFSEEYGKEGEGGFLVENQPHDVEERILSTQKHGKKRKVNIPTNEIPVPYVKQTAPREASRSNFYYLEVRKADGRSEKQGDGTSEMPLHEASSPAVGRPTVPTKADRESLTDEGSDSLSRGSLLSHDPDDEDAEPIWRDD